MSDTLDDKIDQRTFFLELEKAGLDERLIDSFRDDVSQFISEGISFEYRRKINGKTNTYYLKTNHKLYGTIEISLPKKYLRKE